MLSKYQQKKYHEDVWLWLRVTQQGKKYVEDLIETERSREDEKTFKQKEEILNDILLWLETEEEFKDVLRFSTFEKEKNNK